MKNFSGLQRFEKISKDLHCCNQIDFSIKESTNKYVNGDKLEVTPRIKDAFHEMDLAPGPVVKSILSNDEKAIQLGREL